MLEPLLTKQLKEILSEFLFLKSFIHFFHVHTTFKLASIKPLIKKTQLDTRESQLQAFLEPFLLSKIVKKVVSSQLCSILDKINGISEDFKSGFRLYNSIETALIRVTNYLLLSSDLGCFSLIVLVDLRAAFDTIDHSILLNRLKLCWH